MPEVTPNSQSPQGEADAVSKIAALLDAEKVTPDKPEEEKPDEAQPEGDAEPGNNAQVEGDDAPATEKAVAEIPLDQLEAIELEVEVSAESGKRVEKVPIKELKLGYMRQKDYSVKTAEVARQREEVGQKVRQGIESERTQYQTTLQQFQNALIETVAPELKDVNWNQLATDDPFKYVQLRNRADQIVSVLNGMKQKETEAKTKADADALEAKKEQAQKTWSQLESDIPGWNQELYQSVVKAAEPLGFQPGEVGSWLDARQIKLLHKAYLYDQLKAGKPPAEKKVVVAPKAIAPGTATNASKPAQQRAKAMERLQKRGTVNDLTDVIATML